jgi:hypothetical protein
MHLTPAEYVVEIFGGVRKAGVALGRTASSISKWKKSDKNGGCGGRVPSRMQEVVLQVARIKKLDITAEDLINGRDVADVVK